MKVINRSNWALQLSNSTLVLPNELADLSDTELADFRNQVEILETVLPDQKPSKVKVKPNVA
jgi:hypothetical protein